MRAGGEMDAVRAAFAIGQRRRLGSRSMLRRYSGGANSLLPCADMGQSLADRIQSAIEKQGLLRAGERVGVAVSGGADSVALLLLLVELRKQLGIVLSVVHFNHKLRGKDSDADEKFAGKLAEKYGLAFHAGRADIAAKAKSNKANVEDTARR